MLDKAGFSIHLDAFQTQHAATRCNPPIPTESRTFPWTSLVQSCTGFHHGDMLGCNRQRIGPGNTGNACPHENGIKWTPPLIHWGAMTMNGTRNTTHHGGCLDHIRRILVAVAAEPNEEMHLQIGDMIRLSPEIVLRRWNSGVPTLGDYEGN